MKLIIYHMHMQLYIQVKTLLLEKSHMNFIHSKGDMTINYHLLLLIIIVIIILTRNALLLFAVYEIYLVLITNTKLQDCYITFSAA